MATFLSTPKIIYVTAALECLVTIYTHRRETAKLEGSGQRVEGRFDDFALQRKMQDGTISDTLEQ
jgi:hypothetical protein